MSRSTRPTDDGRTPAAASQRSHCIDGQRHVAPPLAPGLYLVATPIGNLRDVTLRALDVLAAADLIACEDTRVTRKLTAHYGISAPLTPYHEHNAGAARPRLLARLTDGAAIALVSDAGTPLVSDPGYKLVHAAQEAGHTVIPVPGPSAILAALTKAGLPTDRFIFDGFLPPKAAARQARIAALGRIPATLILFESGPRLAAALGDLADGLGPRPASICRELTKLHEEARAGDLAGLAQHYAEAGAPRGEIVIVVAPPAGPPAASDDDVDALLHAALGRTTLKQAVSEIAAVTGQPRRAVYQRALAIGKDGDDADR